MARDNLKDIGGEAMTGLSPEALASTIAPQAFTAWEDETMYSLPHLASAGTVAWDEEPLPRIVLPKWWPVTVFLWITASLFWAMN